MSWEIDSVVTALHDRLCECGRRCDGWHADRRALLAFSERRWGSEYAIENALRALSASADPDSTA